MQKLRFGNGSAGATSEPCEAGPGASRASSRGRRRMLSWLSGAALALGAPWPLAHAGAYEDFFAAIPVDDASTIRLLMLRGISANSPDRKFGPALVYAASLKSFRVVRALLESPLTNADIRNASGESALMFAALAGEIEVARLLVSRGGQVNHPGWTPLHYAASGGNVEMVRWLLEQNAYIDAPSVNLTTPLMMAARERQPTLVRILVQEGADPSLRNETGLTAADYAQRAADPETAQWLRAQADAFTRKYGTREQPVPAVRPQ